MAGNERMMESLNRVVEKLCIINPVNPLTKKERTPILQAARCGLIVQTETVTCTFAEPSAEHTNCDGLKVTRTSLPGNISTSCEETYKSCGLVFFRFRNTPLCSLSFGVLHDVNADAKWHVFGIYSGFKAARPAPPPRARQCAYAQKTNWHWPGYLKAGDTPAGPRRG